MVKTKTHNWSKYRQSMSEECSAADSISHISPPQDSGKIMEDPCRKIERARSLGTAAKLYTVRDAAVVSTNSQQLRLLAHDLSKIKLVYVPALIVEDS